MTSGHWGDLAPVSDSDFGIAVLEREQLIKPRSMEVDGPRLYQPSSHHLPPATVPTASDMKIDPTIKHTIELNKYAAKLQKMICFVQQQYNTENADEIAFPATPDLPVFKAPAPRIQKSKLLPFLYKDVDTPKEDFKAMPLDDYHCRKLTRRAVALIMAHIGLETCAFSILETMTDLCSDYVSRLTASLRRARDAEAMTGRSGFPDIISHVFHEIGIGEVAKIHDFYQERVIQYHDHMIRRCEKLREKYEQVKNPEYRNTSEFKASTMKEEVMSDIQFPTFTEEDPQFHGDNLSALGLEVEEAVHDERWMKTEQKTNDYDSVSDDGSPTPDLEVVHERGGVDVSSMMGQPPPKIRKID